MYSMTTLDLVIIFLTAMLTGVAATITVAGVRDTLRVAREHDLRRSEITSSQDRTALAAATSHGGNIKRTALVATFGVLIAGSLGVGIGWYVADQDADGRDNVAEAPLGDAPLHEPPVSETDVDLNARDVEGEPATASLIEFIEGMSMPDGAVTVSEATMIPHNEVYYVVAAMADTPDGEQILTYLHEPWDQTNVGSGGHLSPLNEAAQQWAPLAPASDDFEALELGDQLIVGQ